MVLASLPIIILPCMHKNRYSWLLVLPILAGLHCKKSDNNNNPTGPVDTKDSVLVSNLSFPWEILWGPDNFIWMTERGGKISRVNPSTGEVIPLLTISEVVSNGEG